VERRYSFHAFRTLMVVVLLRMMADIFETDGLDWLGSDISWLGVRRSGHASTARP